LKMKEHLYSPRCIIPIHAVFSSPWFLWSS
jgi:hypothetical protein